MPSSNILLFDANKANMMADEQYSTNTQRLNGVQSGIASSQLQNKTLYQVSLVAYAIAQIMNQNGLDANDTAAVSAFVANLSGTMLQKVADLATTQEAQAGVATGKWMSPALVKAAMNTYTANKWLPLTGGTMQGNLILNADPMANLGAATKQYVDKKDSMVYKRYKLFEITKNYNNISDFAMDKIFTFQNLTLNDLGFLPQRLLIEFSSQDYMALSSFEISLSLTDMGHNKIISLNLPIGSIETVRIKNISLSLVVYLSSYFDRVIDPNNINFGGVSIILPEINNRIFNFTEEYSFFIIHNKIDGTITASAYLS